MRIEGTALQSPTEIAALTDGRLLLADQGRILLLTSDGEKYRLHSQFSSWSDRPEQHFGQRLRLAVHGPWSLVSDTDRHRVVWLDWTRWRFLAQFGETDEAGDDSRHVSGPTFVALRGTRAVVADTGNQRVLKLLLTP